MSSIGGIGGSASGMMAGLYGAQGAKRQSATEVASELFSKIDTAGKGSIEKTDLQAALTKANSGSTAVSATPNVDDLFSALDTNGSGQVTQQEFTDSLQKLSDQLDQQHQSRRVQDAVAQAGLGGGQGMGGGMPPPPPPSAGDQPGLSKEQMSSRLSEVSGDPQLTSLLSNTLKNFEVADTNQDGKVSAQEAMAYQKASESSTASQAQTQTDQGASSSASSESGSAPPAQLMRQVAQLFQAYMGSQIATASGSISVTA